MPAKFITLYDFSQLSGDGGMPSSAGIFVGGFILGGIVVGTLGSVYAPQISKALAGIDRKDLMRKLPKFIYDEEKALETQTSWVYMFVAPDLLSSSVLKLVLFVLNCMVTTDKIAQLNSAIDEVSAQLHTDDAPNRGTVNPDEIEAVEL
ncbi:hypothetical protein HS088_TW01G01031 [Tripterygium wilfordii]|uniref:Uncharacterized protein n=1 Tax=Tripterygium wilfordii TaxID=458696 RepID=A0A7J7E371_TRIWF|nr:hypothetical protein HS088_TW01G01031 [Tripterygium wilfordii]